MTLEELNKVPFSFVSHMSGEHEHCSTYTNKEYGFAMCTHTKCLEGISYGRTITHYLYKDKVYKSLRKFLEAIEDVEFKG